MSKARAAGEGQFVGISFASLTLTIATWQLGALLALCAGAAAQD
jgi:hypothetical protein